MKAAPLAILAFLAATKAFADPPLHRFEVWKDETTSEKMVLYIGWTNGFLIGRGEIGVSLEKCLSTLTYQQAVAMINKYFDTHPERWSATLTEGMIEALTVPGSACEGKNPLPK